MALEVWNGSTWTTMTDPEIWNGSSWVNINHGEVWNGSSWVTFYSRNSNEVYSDLDTISKTKTSIKLGVNHIGTDRRRAVVWIDGLFSTTAQTTGVFTSNMVASNTATQLDFTSLTRGTTYQFDSYIEYLDSSDNVISTGPSMPVLHEDTTLDYTITTPTTPTNTGTITSTSLTFTSSSNANYSNNGVSATLYFYLHRVSDNALIDTLSSALPNNDTLTSRTVTFSGLSHNTQYYCRARTYYGGAINSYSSYSSYSSGTYTYTFHVPVAPGKLDDYTTDTVITMVTTGNAYNNGDAYLYWERATRAAGSSDAWSYSYFADTGNVFPNDATSRFYSYSFSANQTNEYKFRARVYYRDLTYYHDWGPYSDTVRPKLWVRTYIPSASTYAAASQTAYFPGSSFGASSENGSASKYNASDNNSSTQWESYPYKTVTGTETHTRSLAYFSRNSTYNLNAYYNSTNDFDFDANYPNVTTTVSYVQYGISTSTLQKGGNVKVVLDSSSRIQLSNGDFARIVGSSSSAYNQLYIVSSAAGDTVYLTPYDSAISSPSSASNGVLRVTTSNGTNVSVFGGTSARVSEAANYVTRFDYDYGYDVPLSSAGGSILYTVGTSTKVAKTSSDTDYVNVLFVPSLPSGYRDAKLEGVAVQIGAIAASRIQIEINGTQRFDSGGFGTVANGWIYLSGFSATPTYAGNAFFINCIVYPGYYSGDGLYYSTIKEIQLRYSYETLTG